MASCEGWAAEKAPRAGCTPWPGENKCRMASGKGSVAQAQGAPRERMRCAPRDWCEGGPEVSRVRATAGELVSGSSKAWAQDECDLEPSD